MLDTQQSEDKKRCYYNALFNVKGVAAQVFVQVSLIRCYLILINLNFPIYKIGLNWDSSKFKIMKTITIANIYYAPGIVLCAFLVSQSSK